MERLTVDAEQQTENFSLHSGREQLSESIWLSGNTRRLSAFTSHASLTRLGASSVFRVAASEDGMSDYNCIDVIREARATVVAAAQSSTSFIPPLGREKARVFTLNLRNRIIFKAAGEEGALESADFLGKKRVIKKSWGYHSGKMSRNYSEQEEHKIKPHILRNLPKHMAIVVHCERGYRRKLLSPIEPSGAMCAWFRNI